MALFGTLESIIHVQQFTNIHCCNQGVYYIRISVTDDEDDQASFEPGEFFSKPKNQNYYVKNTEVPIPRSKLGKCHVQDHFFCSRMFAVVYKGTTLELNEGCNFKIKKQVQCEADNISFAASLKVRFELMLFEVTLEELTDSGGRPHHRRLGSGRSTHLRNHDIHDNQLKPDSFKCIATHEVIFRQVNFGTVHDFIPITFTESSFAKLDVVLHMAVTSLRFHDLVAGKYLRAPSSASELGEESSTETYPPNKRKGTSFGGLCQNTCTSCVGCHDSEKVDESQSMSFLDFAFPGAVIKSRRDALLTGAAAVIMTRRDSTLRTVYDVDGQIEKYNTFLTPMVESLEALSHSLHDIHDKYYEEHESSSLPRWKNDKAFARKPARQSLMMVFGSVEEVKVNIEKHGASPLESHEFLAKAIHDIEESSPLHPFNESNAQPGDGADLSANPAETKATSGRSSRESSKGKGPVQRPKLSKRERLSKMLFISGPTNWMKRNKGTQVVTAAESIQRDMEVLNDYCKKGWASLYEMLSDSGERMCQRLTTQWLNRQKHQWEHAIFFRQRRSNCKSRSDGCNLPDIQNLLKCRAFGARRFVHHSLQDLLTFGNVKYNLCCTIEVYGDEELQINTNLRRVDSERLPILTTARPTESSNEMDDEQDIYMPAWHCKLLGPSASTFEEEVQLLQPRESRQVFVLQHGLHGHDYDMDLFENHLKLLFPDALILNSTVNSEDTEQDLSTMGELLAKDVQQFCFQKCPELLSFHSEGNKISFIAHSAGGLIVRAALTKPFMKRLSRHFHMFITLSSPHLGNLGSSHLVSTGLHFLNWTSSIFGKSAGLLKQLLFEDSSSLKDTYLFKLSQDDSLSAFNHVVLVTAHEDHYVPKYSSLIQMPEATGESNKEREMHSQMIDNILSKIPPERLQRINVFNDFSGIHIDTLIGRAAHTSFLDSSRLVNMLVFSLHEKLK